MTIKKYAAYNVSEWLFDLEATSPGEALALAHERDGNVTHVELTSEVSRF